jgi:hypothetical protein
MRRELRTLLICLWDTQRRIYPDRIPWGHDNFQDKLLHLVSRQAHLRATEHFCQLDI